MLDIITSILSAAVMLSTPILFSAIGEAFDEKAGVLNMGIEGIMALAAFVSWVIPAWSFGRNHCWKRNGSDS